MQSNRIYHIRSLLKVLALVLLILFLAGCTQGQKVVDRPEDFSESTVCALDGMFLGEHGGPKAQVQYRGGRETDFLCNIPELFKIYAEPGNKAEITKMFVQNTSAIDWNKPMGNWIEAEVAYYVVGSKRTGSMGPTYAPFKDKITAEKFSKIYGGKIQTFPDLAK